ncbi:hypothetical protein IAU60_006575 [Kwoniella sp. DSM 27419]
MLWRFGFASSSTLDALLTREVPPQVEELLDEQDVIQECKAQNNKLVAFLSREDSVKSLLQWVIAGLDELDQAAAAADVECLSQALSSPDLYPSYRAPQPMVIPGTGPSSPPLVPSNIGVDPEQPNGHGRGDVASERKKEADEDEDQFDGAEIGLGKGLRRKSEGEEEMHKSRYPNVATEVLCCAELWSIADTIVKHSDHLLMPFWDAVLPPISEPTSPTTASGTDEQMNSSIVMSRQEAGERERARNEFWSEKDEERDRRREMIRGMWMRVNGTLLTKRTSDMIRFIRSLPNIVERLVAGIASPAIQDILIRIVSAEEAGVPGVIDWLADEGLIPRLLEYLSPYYSSTVHTNISEVLKSIITLCAPTPFNPHGGNAMGQQAGQGVQPNGSRDNRLIRELVSEQSIDTMVGFMLDPVKLSDSDWQGINGSDGDESPADPFVTHPLPSIASATSSLHHTCSVLVEVIRRNNSDFSEPHLFHTLRNRLMSVRMQPGPQNTGAQPLGTNGYAGNGVNGASQVGDEAEEKEVETEQEKEEQERRHMEEALADMSSKMGIVHLGHLLNLVSERFEQLHSFVLHPRSQSRSASVAMPKPFTLERFRIIELYAELLHSSNMSILNRIPGTGPSYTEAGILSGGLEGLEALGEAIDGDQVGEDDGQPEVDQVTKARELPVSSGSTDASLESDTEDVPSDDDEDMMDHLDDDATPSSSPTASKVLPTTFSDKPVDTPVVIPPPSQADVKRLRDVMETESKAPASSAASDVEAASTAAVASSTAAPSIASAASDAGVEVDETSQPVAGASSETSQKPTVPSPAPVKAAVNLAPGDRLKKIYATHRVIPTVVDLFFEYPNNDFMHHVVYDILQQILNGRLGPGPNRDLALELIKEARLVERVLEAQRLNDRLVAQPRTPRLAYMGHLILIAEEVVKFFSRCPPELYELIKDSFVPSEWAAFVDGSLSETKARDTKPLAGGKPMSAPGAMASAEAVSGMGGAQSRDDDSSSDDDDDGDEGHAVKFGEPLTRTSAGDGFAHRGEYDAYADQEGDEEGMERFWRNSGVGLNRRSMDSSDDDDDDADWMRPSVNSSWGTSGDDDDFGAWETAPGPSRPVNGRDDFDDDDGDGWGSFNAAASPFESPDPNAENPFGDGFAPSVVRPSAGEPLTPRDWAEQFDRAFAEDPEKDGQGEDDGVSGDAPAIVMPSAGDDDDEDEDDEMEDGTRVTMTAGVKNWKFSGDDEGVDLPPTASPTLPQVEKAESVQASRPPELAAPVTVSGITAAVKANAGKRAPPVPPSRSAASTSPLSSPSSRTSSTGSSPTIRASTSPISIPRRRLSQHKPHPGHPGSGSPQSPIRKWGEAFSPPDPSLIAAATEESPLGPGVSPDTHITGDGLLEREIGGQKVRVPQDEIVEAIERKADEDEEDDDVAVL